MDTISIYIHWPFCVSKCLYCDFNSHAAKHEINYNRWIKAYKKALGRFDGLLRQRTIKSVYFGGGTPSIMPPFAIHEILSALYDLNKFDRNIEITLEINPSTAETQKLTEFKNAGINRASVGIQSLRNENLKFLGRTHCRDTALAAMRQASDIFPASSFDMIYALPNQTPDDWHRELNTALNLLKCTHVSLYQLTVSKGTALYTKYINKEFELPTEDDCNEMYNLTLREAGLHGMYAYEISNYAVPGRESLHNLRYWEYHDYLGIGPGAHSRISLPQKTAMYYKYNPDIWLRGIEGENEAVLNTVTLTTQDVINEMLIMGLRLHKGLNKQRFFQITGKHIGEIIPTTMYDSLEINDECVRIPDNKKFITDHILEALITV